MKLKRILASGLLVIAMVSTFTMSASADVTDQSYGYLGYVSSSITEATYGRYKENTTRVYVKPNYAPQRITKVNTLCYVSNQATDKTINGTRFLSDDQAYAITNYVYEHGDITQGKGVLMWLGIGVTSSGYVDGVWSPDSVWEPGIQYV